MLQIIVSIQEAMIGPMEKHVVIGDVKVTLNGEILEDSDVLNPQMKRLSTRMHKTILRELQLFRENPSGEDAEEVKIKEILASIEKKLIPALGIRGLLSLLAVAPPDQLSKEFSTRCAEFDGDEQEARSLLNEIFKQTLSKRSLFVEVLVNPEYINDWPF